MVLDIEQYPEFVPWCLDGKVYEKKVTDDFIEIKKNLNVSKKFINEMYYSILLY